MLDSNPTLKAAAVRIHGVEKVFGGNTVLSDLDLSIAPGEFLSIVGKSGCGKSTLLRLITGLDSTTSGEITVDGQTPAQAAGTLRIMFQEPRLLPWATVAGNVAVGLPETSHPAVLAGRIRGALDEVQLADRSGDWPSSLSGGQKQRVALARALVSRPHLLALDEPLGALDALTRLVMQDLILQVKREVGFTAILVTHDVAEAVALSDRVIVLDGGRIVHQVQINLPHPRPRASAEIVRIEAGILAAIFGDEPQRR